MRKVLLRGSGLLAVVLLVAACSGGIDGPVVSGDQRSSGEDAEIIGELVIEGDCLYLHQAETETRYPVIWPHGTKWDSGEPAVVLPGDTLVHEGDEVYGGGGYHQEDLSEYTSQEGVDLIASCVNNTWDEVAVFNSGGTMAVRP